MNNKNDNVEEPKSIKLVIIGELAVGKSSILMRFCDDEFGLNMIGTSGVDFRTKLIKIGSSEIKLCIYDTAGQSRFKSITKHFFQDADGIIVVYDTSDKATYDNLKEWIKTIKENARESVEITIVGNKIDLPKQVSSDDGKAYAKLNNVNFVETSAKNGTGVEKLFDSIVNNILKRHEINEKNELAKNILINKVSDNEKKNKSKGCWCG